MGIKKEYVCFAHGPFEADQPVCPSGCTVAIERQFRTAPALKSPRTRNIDHTLATLARDFGYTDLSNKSGSVAGGKKRELNPIWKPIPKGDVQEAGGVIKHRDGSQGGAAAAYAAEKPAPARDGEVGFNEIKPALTAPRPFVEKRFQYGTGADLAAAVRSTPDS